MNLTTFDDSDSVRSGKPLKHVQTAVFPGPFVLEAGGVLAPVTVAYETFGQLNAAKDNAILLCHALSGDSHVARHDDADDPGWWDLSVGPGKPVDTNRFFVVCANMLGGCRGTTGPGSLNPATGEPYGSDFPTVTIRDVVETQRLLMDQLGIPQWLAVIGGSLGGHQAMTWATAYPDRVRGCGAIATSPRLSSQALAFDVVARNAIRRDPHFQDGQYYGKTQTPETGLALARMIGHITYLSAEAMTRKFDVNRMRPREVSTEFEKVFSVGSYLGYQGDRFVDRFDANSYVAITMAMDLFDLGATPAQLTESFRPARCKWLVLSFSSDWLFWPSQARAIVNALIANNHPVSYCNVRSSCGHDAFLLPDEFPIYGEMIRAFIDNLANGKDHPAPELSEAELLHPASIFQKHQLDYDRIVELIPANASALDLGCGSGGLLSRLSRKGNGRRLMGVELDERQVLAAVRRGFDVVQADLNEGLGGFSDHQFDYVVLSRTLQAVTDVEGLVKEMLRVGRTSLVTFPNFGYSKLRKMLSDEGRSPKTGGVLPYEWFNTPNRRFFSMLDFDDFCAAKNIRVHRRIGLDTEAGVEVLDNPNLNADLAVYVISQREAGELFGGGSGI